MHRYDRGWGRGYGERGAPRRYGAWYGQKPERWGHGYGHPSYGAPWAYSPGPAPWWSLARYDAPFIHDRPPPQHPGRGYAAPDPMPGAGWPGHPGAWERQRERRHDYAGDFESVFDDDFDDDDFSEFGAMLDEFGDEPEDAELVARVTAALRRDGFLDSEAIAVSVDEGVITLRGEVGDYMQARYAWDDAWEVPGVRGVVSKLTVRGMERQEAPTNAARKATAPQKKS